MKILILGVNGFIGHNLLNRALKDTDWQIYGIDIGSDRLGNLINNPRFHFIKGDITVNGKWVERHIKRSDVVIPLVAIATPSVYIKNPVRIFELDFEENVKVIRQCVKYKKRLIFPSTSEVYGMCPDKEFDEDTSNLVLGPIKNHRWIYSCCKQLLDRIIWAYGIEKDLKFTIIRPYNWIGPKLDSMHSDKEGSPRVITQFMSALIDGTPIYLVNGGRQRRSFTDVEDGIDCLVRIIKDDRKNCDKQIFNIGNPQNDISIKGLACKMRSIFLKSSVLKKRKKISDIVEISGDDFYGKGYQDVKFRIPSIKRAEKLLGWKPKISLDATLKKTIKFYLADE